MDFGLSEEQRAIWQSAHDFASREWAPHAAKWDEQGHFPRDAIERAGQLGFCGLYVDEALGGVGLSRLDATLVFEALATACPSTAAYLSIHNMATAIVARHAQPSVAQQWAPRLASGQALASYCLTEPDAGSDAAALRTQARRSGSNYCLSGSKMFISGAGASDVLVVMARTGGPGADGISAFLVPADSPGIHFGPKERKLGWNSQPTRAIVFEDVLVPENHRLGAEGHGFRIALQGLDGGRVNIAACSLGAAYAAWLAAQNYVQQRSQFGRPLASQQALQFRLADMATALHAARLVVRQAAAKLDEGAPDATMYCAMAKRWATDVGFEVCNQALQLHGGYGCTRDFPLERLLRDARVHQIVEGTNEIMRVIVARHILQSPTILEPTA